MPVTYPGTFDIQIEWDPRALRMWRQYMGTFWELQNFQYFWAQYDIKRIIQNGLRENIANHVDPLGVPWAPLSDRYQQYLRRQGTPREYMKLRSEAEGSETGIYDAYVENPSYPRYEKTYMVYSPDLSRMMVTGAIDIKLRFGSGPMPGREWFGISSKTNEKINKQLNVYLYERLREAGKVE